MPPLRPGCRRPLPPPLPLPLPTTRLAQPPRCRYSSSSSPSWPSRNDLPESRLNPRPDDYAAPSFADRAELSLFAGRGGNGCVSFLREAFLPDGPPNGGDGGPGGSIYIQAAHGETSLHKLARKRVIRAGRGSHGQGSAKGGARGQDVVITVPVGTVLRELHRHEPAAQEALAVRAYRALRKQQTPPPEEPGNRDPAEAAPPRQQQQQQQQQQQATDRKGRPKPAPGEAAEQADAADLELQDPSRQKWLLYPGMSRSDMRAASFPKLPRRQPLLQQPPAPVYLDLSRPTPRPILLAAGGLGGLGNPHFTSRQHPKPVFATKGDDAVSIKVSLELRLLADVGLVGPPNAGKSTLLRSLTNSRARIGSWAFTTLQPNIGTVVLDKYSGRPVAAPPGAHPGSLQPTRDGRPGPRTRFTVADIPGLIQGAHLDRGLGIAFLRHVERAGVLAFVVDLAAGNAADALDALWREVGLYAQMRHEEDCLRQVESHIDWDPASDSPPTLGAVDLANAQRGGPTTAFAGPGPPSGLHIAAKPWFVVATKADLPQTRQNFLLLKAYLDEITSGQAKHPSGVEGAWTTNCAAIPVSAIHGQGVDRIVHWTLGLLDG
ncbi:uncharacterized protein UV8b_01107 [Ustilaginoidea virens]|uniref:GTP-binding protein Obg n=1 Tax=Ustilaginoidea virens TaxID=1159556 RepID=A0A8E5MEY2_USTVR|nr:uncharacterized protein UV8b_01107 [Ustilaginoidea virens]QUC16866.1 hypothetical protein UV8b_01107 [Ustilaginoidea virens]